MAISNWDTLAVDLNGQPCSGFFISPLGIEVAFYKNWIYVRDPKAWHEGGHFIKPTIAQIQSGNLDYMDVSLQFKRGLQNGVYGACWSQKFKDNRYKYLGMIGCSVYGYEQEQWVGVAPSSVKFLQAWINVGYITYSDKEIDEIVKEMESHYQEIGYIWAEEEKTKYIKELKQAKTFDFPEEIRKVKLDQATRFNQGDKFFADKGFDVSAIETKPGKAGETVLSQIVKSMQA